MSTGKVVEFKDVFGRDPDRLAVEIALLYDRWKNLRNEWERDKLELRKYLFATDTTKTTNSKLPWKNSTTLPKLTQIRDNLHANYMAALIPNEDWFKWEGDPSDPDSITKARTIEAYMKNKLRQLNFRNILSSLVLDYIDYGNVFAEAYYSSEYHTLPDGTLTLKYRGPKVRRISPFDIVFDISAASFHDTPKITRTMTSFGELLKRFQTEADAGWAMDVKEALMTARSTARTLSTGTRFKEEGLKVDGFNTYMDYLNSGYVEILEFEGDLYDQTSDTLLEAQRIIVVDRAFLVFMEPLPSWLGRSPKEHAGWRLRPDNLMAMGPLDNLVGMQYRIDHLENLRADVFDQIAHPVVYQRGWVEPWEWGPQEVIYGDIESDVKILAPDATALNADFQIQSLQNMMEEMAGAPRQAMGIRTPGEKTAFEVQVLENATGRIFQNKVAHFEAVFLEPLLNQMLEVARRNLNEPDIISIQDPDLGAENFKRITREDIQAKGKLRPKGSSRFARKNLIAQTLFNLTSTGLYQDPAVQVHISGKRIAEMLEDLLELDKFQLVKDNVRVMEQVETQSMVQVAQQQLAAERGVGPENFDVTGAAAALPPEAINQE